jgi:hypothetical protein
MTTTPDESAVTNGTVSANVRAELARADMNQSDLAAALKRDRSWIADRLNGRADWRVHDVVIVARAIGCTVSTLAPNLTEES